MQPGRQARRAKSLNTNLKSKAIWQKWQEKLKLSGREILNSHGVSLSIHGGAGRRRTGAVAAFNIIFFASAPPPREERENLQTPADRYNFVSSTRDAKR